MSGQIIIKSRYPYTYACDYIRSASPYNEQGCILSRSDASKIMHLISSAFDIEYVEVANKLANKFLNCKLQIHPLKKSERFIPPENAISYKIITICGNKQAQWLEPIVEV